MLWGHVLLCDLTCRIPTDGLSHSILNNEPLWPLWSLSLTLVSQKMKCSSLFISNICINYICIVLYFIHISPFWYTPLTHEHAFIGKYLRLLKEEMTHLSSYEGTVEFRSNKTLSQFNTLRGFAATTLLGLVWCYILLYSGYFRFSTSSHICHLWQQWPMFSRSYLVLPLVYFLYEKCHINKISIDGLIVLWHWLELW